MRVQIFAPIAGGPMSRYVAFLLTPLAELVRSGDVSCVIVSLSRSHFESVSFERSLRPFTDVVWDVFEDDVADLDWRSGLRCAGALLRAVDWCEPDHVISVSADYGALALALRSLPRRSLGRRTRALTAVGIVHHGIASDGRGVRAKVRGLVHRISRALSPWTVIFVVNPLLYDAIRARGANDRRVRLLPHPVERLPPIAKTDARGRLGLPAHRRYLSHVGKTDGRKAIPELLDAFRAARLDDEVRLVLGGSLHRMHRERLATIDADMVASGRVIVIDRDLSDEEFHTLTCASDVVVSANYPMDDLSANLLAAVAARRPVVVNDYGYAGYMVRRLSIGWACDVTKPADFARTLETAVRESDALQPDARSHALLEFHDPRHYTDVALAEVYRQVGREMPSHASWESVIGS